MPVVQTSLFAVSKRFPDRMNAIKRLFRENEVFQGLCEDYRRCAEAVEHWKRSTSEEASLLRKEYEALLRDLETEIMERLRDSHK
jgi:hypothetical protein